MERFAVTAATGALGPILKKLTALLGDEYKLHEKTREDIMFIKSELDPVHDLLLKLWGRLDLDEACKDWMMEARELSYDMEDGIDSFTDGLERGDGSVIQREATDSPFKQFMERVKDLSKLCGEMQKVGDTICNRSKLTTDPRALFLHKDASELVGMEEKKEKLIELLVEHEMVCIHGPGGMGKTTLADLVCQTIGDEFQCRAFVSVHPNPNMMDILGSILSQVTNGAMAAGSGTKPAAEENIVTDISISFSDKSGEQNDLTKGISSFLSDKRYLVIIDDIWHWEEWEVIRKAFPKNNLGCKLIMTTRMSSIVWKCRTQEQDACGYQLEFYHKDAERLSAIRLSKCVKGTNAIGTSTEIADMCGLPPFHSCPLAVICLSSAWAESHQGCDGEWDTWAEHVLGDGFLSTPSLKPLVQSLCLGFDDLPAELKTCLLYCAVYPLGYEIDRGCLVRKWIAEGFVSQIEVADSYLEDLVSRNLLDRDMWMHAVHPIMLAFLVCKAKEDNFIAYDGPFSHAKLQIRRLSLSTDRFPDEDLLYHTRSLVVSGYECQLDGVPLEAFKKLRVLEVYNSSRLENRRLVDICGQLIWLKYLGILCCDQITELPREIGTLQNLVSLHVAGTHISKLPTEIKNLERLETLDISRTDVTELPPCIEKLQSLKNLNVSQTDVMELPPCIEKLQSLKNLNVSQTDVTELPTWIEKLQSLKTLNVSETEVAELPREIRSLERLETLNISQTRVRELPKEIRKLQHLRTLDVRGTKVRELPWQVQNSINVHVGEPHYGTMVKLAEAISPDWVISSSGANCRGGLSIVFFDPFNARCEEPLQVPLLRVDGRHMKVPQWVKQDLCNVCSLDIRLWKLVEEDLEFLKTHMPNLQALELRFEVLPREPVAITGGGFPKLGTFYVDSRLPWVVTFMPGAMPMLKHLEFKFYSGAASQDYSMGIKHLKSLEVVLFQCSEYYTSDAPGICDTIDAVRKEAVEHPNEEIRLWVNDANIFVRHTRNREKQILMEAEERRKSHLLAAEKRAQQDKYRGRGGIRS